MLKSIKGRAAAVIAVTLLCANAAAQPVIPGAVGFGMNTPAGRGGKIFRVTNLKDNGEGSLRACVESSGPRICVFEVSGAIRLARNLSVNNPNLTIAGQTAPAPGIMLRGASLVVRASDVLIQHLAVRVGDERNGPAPQSRDSLKIGGHSLVQNVVIDHSSISWSVDEAAEIWGNWDNITIANSILAEPLHDSLHPKGSHGLTMLIGTNNKDSKVTLVGNLLAHGHGRNPRSNAADFAFINNVVYNARAAAIMLFNKKGIKSENSIIGNVFKKGPESVAAVKPIRLTGSASEGVANQIILGTKLYLSDNLVDGAAVSDDPWAIVDNQCSIIPRLLQALSVPSLMASMRAMPTEDNAVLNSVLENAGTRPAQRNSVDSRIVADVRNGTGRIINCVTDDGSNRCARNGGGWPALAENYRKLDVPVNPNEDDDGNGYTNVEEWLQAMAADVEGQSNSPSLPDDPGVAPPMPPVITHN